MVKREQRQNKKDISLRGDKTILSNNDQIRYVIEGLPQVSSVIANRLLNHFGNIKTLANANEKELQEVFGVGKRIANDVYKILNEDYQK
jgi:Fanconi anemia group M protein